jgi:hypothetical protein
MPVHARPSLQKKSVGLCTHAPVAGWQTSMVQSTLSSHCTGVPGWQMPSTHCSAPLHSVSSWHSAWSPQGWPVVQPPCAMTQNSPGAQAALLGTCSQSPVASLHASTVHETPSGPQGTGMPPTQPLPGGAEAEHVSTPLQGSPSSQAACTGVCVQLALPSSHASAVHETPSSQSGATPGWQPSCALHVSAPLQKSPSSQSAALGT